jgi:hypothetical protein
MSTIYQTIIKVLGVIAVSLLVVAAILFVKGNQINAEIAFGIGISVLGITLMMYSLRR